MDVGEYIRRKGREQEQKAGKTQTMTTQEAVEKYSHMSEEQLMQELFNVGRVSNGNVTEKEYDDFYQRVKPFLTPEQSAKMKSLILQLKMQRGGRE